MKLSNSAEAAASLQALQECGLLTGTQSRDCSLYRAAGLSQNPRT